MDACLRRVTVLGVGALVLSLAGSVRAREEAGRYGETRETGC